MTTTFRPTDTAFELPDKTTLINAVRAANAKQREAEIEQLALVAAMCEVWSVTDSSCWDSVEPMPPNVLFGEQLVTPGADGTPQVAEFLALELGCALEVSPDSARALVADVLNLRHRLPIVWEKALTGEVRVWVARKIAQATTGLTLEEARRLDTDLGPRLHGLGPSAALREAARLVVVYDQDADEVQQQALAQRSISLRPDPAKGVAWVEGTMDPVAARHLDATLDRGAQVLALGGHDGGRDELRSVTLGVLAHPARAYHLVDEGLPLESDGVSTPTSLNDRSETLVERPGTLVERGAQRRVETSEPRAGERIGAVCEHGAELIVRVGRDEIRHNAGGALDAFGPITKTYLAEVLAGCSKVTVRPVIDLAEPLTVASYKPTPRVAWAVKERDRREMFHYSNRSAHGRGIDCDHTTNYDGNNTTTANLGSLSRRAHRAKTHGGYRVQQPEPGVFHWVTPAGQELWTSAHGTWRTPPPDLRANEPNATTRTVLGVVLQAFARQDDQRREAEVAQRLAEEQARVAEATARQAEQVTRENRAQHQLPDLSRPLALDEPPASGESPALDEPPPF